MSSEKNKIKMSCIKGSWYVSTTYYGCEIIGIADSVITALNTLKAEMQYVEDYDIEAKFA